MADQCSRAKDTYVIHMYPRKKAVNFEVKADLKTCARIL